MALTITPSSNSATVEWGQVAGAEQYEVSFSTTAAGGNVNFTTYVYEPTRSYTRTTLSPSTNYWVRVMPIDAGNNDMTSSASAWVQFTTTA